MASYPGSVKSFTSRSAGDTIDASHVNELQDEVFAIEGGLLNGTAPLNSSNSTLASLSVAGNSSLGGTLTVTGNSSLTGNLDVTGESTLASLSATGNSTFAASLNIGANLTVSGHSTLVGALQVGGASTFSSAATFGGSVSIGGALSATISSGASAQQDDYVVASSVTLLRLTSDSNSTVSGIQSAGGSLGRLMWVYNVGGTGEITLPHFDAASVSTNRYSWGQSQDHVLKAGDCVLMFYDNNGWRGIRGSTAA